MTDEEIMQLKIKIRKGENLANAIKNDSTCSEGFEAADSYIKYLEEELRWCKNKLKEYYGD